MEICHNVNLDMISDLPANVTDQILVRLPIGDAGRTSVLSTKWRYKWTTIPELVFNDKSALRTPHSTKDRLVNIIDRVLLLHTGFIHKFEISSGWLLTRSTLHDLHCWILFLLRKNIKELVLKFSKWDSHEKYKLPTCFFSAQQQISTLELERCVLKPPPTFTGFSYLKSLCLHNTTFVDDKGGGFECLISKCPLLERLTLDETKIFGHIDHLNICSPNLKYLCIYGYNTFQDICFENTPLLSDISIHTTHFNGGNLNKFLQSETGNVVKVLSSLPNLKKFAVGVGFLKFLLIISKIPEKLPFTCHHLNHLSVCLNFKDVNDICLSLCLLNSSPNLRQLEIECGYPYDNFCLDIENFWEERTLIHWNMSGLQFVKITNVEGFQLELELIKLLLANSPMLEMLSIRCGELDTEDSKGVKFLIKLLLFPRASPKAKIKFIDWHEELMRMSKTKS